MVRVFEGRDKAMHDALISKDQLWLDSLDSFNRKLKAMYYAQVDMEKSMESLSLKRVELIRGNANMLDWAIAATSRKKNIVSPKITISNYISYVIRPSMSMLSKDP